MIRTYAWEPGAGGIECVEAFGVTTNGERVVAYTTQSGRTDLAPLSELCVIAATIPDTLDTTQETS